MAMNLSLELRDIILRLESPLNLAQAVFKRAAASTNFQTRLILLNLGQECR